MDWIVSPRACLATPCLAVVLGLSNGCDTEDRPDPTGGAGDTRGESDETGGESDETGGESGGSSDTGGQESGGSAEDTGGSDDDCFVTGCGDDEICVKQGLRCEYEPRPPHWVGGGVACESYPQQCATLPKSERTACLAAALCDYDGGLYGATVFDNRLTCSSDADCF